MTTAQQKLQAIRVKTQTHPDFAQRPQNAFLKKIETFFYHHRNKLVFVHASMFLFFLALLVIPLFSPPALYNAKFWNNFNEFSQFMVWGLWFPLVFVSVIFSGRSWCGVLCPMGAASEWTNRFGLKRPIPAWLRWEGTPILSFLLITILGQTIDVRDQASAMVEIFLGVLCFALLLGFIYGRGGNKRAWCRHVCPIGLLLGVFSRLSLLEFAPKLLRPATADRYTEKGICPTMVAVCDKKESRHCIECFRCVKPSSPGGLFLRTRRAGAEVENIRDYNPNAAEVWFMFIATGVSLGGFLWLILPSYQRIRQLVGDWFINHDWTWVALPGPSWLMSVHPEQQQVYNWLDFFMIVGYMVFFMGFAFGVLSFCTWLSQRLTKHFGAQGSAKQRFFELGYQFAPVAMLSIIIGLGDKLFATLIDVGMNPTLLTVIKSLLLGGSIIWSLWLGYKIIQRQGVTGWRCGVALLPGLIGSLLIAAAWWPAIFGVDFSLLTEYRTNLLVIN